VHTAGARENGDGDCRFRLGFRIVFIEYQKAYWIGTIRNGLEFEFPEVSTTTTTIRRF
jgi:hypothetical protein